LVLRPLFGLLYGPQMIDDDDCGAIGGMRIGRENRSTLRKPVPVPLCPPQILRDLTRSPNPGRRGGKPATNRLSYGTALLNLCSPVNCSKVIQNDETGRACEDVFLTHFNVLHIIPA
jgi:hypothetical protein